MAKRPDKHAYRIDVAFIGADDKVEDYQQGSLIFMHQEDARGYVKAALDTAMSTGYTLDYISPDRVEVFKDGIVRSMRVVTLDKNVTVTYL